MADYLMRLLEQVARMLAAIVAHRRAGRDEEAARELEAVCLESIGLPLNLVRGASPEALSQLLQQSGGMRHVRAILLAELLLQEAELNVAAGRRGDVIRAQLQAFCLIAEAMPVLSADEAVAYRKKLIALAEALRSASDAPYLQQKLRDAEPLLRA